jgi:hypothetical protein
MLLLVSVGSIYAADNNLPVLSDDVGGEDDFELDEDLGDVDSDGDDDDWDDEDLGDVDSDGDDDDWDDEDLGDVDSDGDDDDWDDEDLGDDDDDWEDDGDDDDWDDDDDDLYGELDDEDSYTDFDFLQFKIINYLDKYGNCSSHNWTDSEEFYSEYQIYLFNMSGYVLNESSEGYKTYLKIFESITSTFGDYNLTENETDYLKFMIIFYLNHYGNVSGNYTWNESESFANYTPPIYLLAATCCIAKGSASDGADGGADSYLHSYENPFHDLFAGNSTDVNQTSAGNQSPAVGAAAHNSSEFNIFIFLLVILLVVLVIV